MEKQQENTHIINTMNNLTPYILAAIDGYNRNQAPIINRNEIKTLEQKWTELQSTLGPSETTSAREKSHNDLDLFVEIQKGILKYVEQANTHISDLNQYEEIIEFMLDPNFFNQVQVEAQSRGRHRC